VTVHLVYETHAITIDNEDGIATGWLPGRLSARGIEAARALGVRRTRSTDIVLTSDLRRAVETAEIAFAGSTVSIIQDLRLRECNYGSLNGAPAIEVAARRRQHIDVPFPGGQSYRDVVEAMREVLHELTRDRDGQRILIIAHSANRWALQHLLNGVPLEELVDTPVAWQPGWAYEVSSTWEAQVGSNPTCTNS
jgi:alpha-ribazole phosphatase/probable phosphoglycerate mutase